MNPYSELARWYNDLTEDVPYSAFADYYESVFREDEGEHSLILDLCCGTGTLSCEMAKRGYDMISVDASPEMLMQARETAADHGFSILFLCQDADELDLYGTVDACFSSLDSINYISPEDLNAALKRLHLFIRPGGLFIFDIRSVGWLQSMDGETYVDENEDVLCLWRADFDESSMEMTYGIDIFERAGKLWKRESEYHTEYAYHEETLRKMLEDTGFEDIRFSCEGPQGNLGRIFVICRRERQ